MRARTFLAIATSAAIASSGCSASSSTGPCHSAADCRTGHDCVGGKCSSACDSTLCPFRQECVSPSGDCLPVDCGERTPCLAAGQICDARIFACFPSNGSCSDAAPCPPLPGDMASSATIACEAGFCRVRSIPLGQVAGLEGGPAVPVAAPVPAQGFASAADVLFQWGGPADAASIALVLDAPIAYASEVDAHALWGAVRGVTAERTALVADGRVIDHGTWLDGPGQLPSGKPLFFLAQLLRPQGLVGSSPLVPFIVGGSWPQPGAVCAGAGTASAECANPALPMTCGAGACLVVCGSQLDCPPGLGCGLFAAGARVCQ